jgi:Spy/CpxP family protein refolding chaperone
MKKQLVSITLVLGLLIGIGTLTYALADDWGRRGPGMHGDRAVGHGIMRMLRALELSDAQKEQVGSALMTARKTAIVSRAQLRVAHMELHEALLQDAVDEAAIGKFKEQIKTLQGDLLDNRVNVQQSISRILTPEQRGKARTMFFEWMEDGGERPFHHRRGGHGRMHGDGEGRGHGPGHRN